MFSTKKRFKNCLTYLMSLWLHVFKKNWITTATGLNAEHCRLAVNETNHCHFMGWFPNAKNKPNWFPIANHDCKRRPLVDSIFFVKMKQRSRRKKIIVELRFLTSWTMTCENCTRAHVQQNKSIYLSIYFSVWKRFWKWVYICVRVKQWTRVFYGI